MPGDRRAPVMADDDRSLLTQRIQQPDHVAGQVEHCVLIDRLRCVGLPVATHIGRHRVVAGLRQCAKLMAPGVPRLRKAVAQQDQGSTADLGNVHPDAVGLDRAMRHFAHHRRHPSSRSGIRIPSRSGTFHTSRTWRNVRKPARR